MFSAFRSDIDAGFSLMARRASSIVTGLFDSREYVAA
jgi:hypothetical protein